MKRTIIYILFVFLCSYVSFAQGSISESNTLEEQNEWYYQPDSVDMKQYTDSLTQLYSGKLLTGCIVSQLREAIIIDAFDCTINGNENVKITPDSLGRFFIRHRSEITQVRLTIAQLDYHLLDTIIALSPNPKPLTIHLIPKYKVVIKGRIYSGNLPLEDVSVKIQHNSQTFSLKTLGCYTDSENYWNCLYNGMYKQAVGFENPNDTVHITFTKKGYRNHKLSMAIGEYDGDIIPTKLRYEKHLAIYPKHNIGINFGLSFNQAFAVNLQYTYQLQMGNFNRLAIGLDGSLINQKVEDELPTFEGLSPTQATSYYNIACIGPVLDMSLTKPTNRYLNIHAGLVGAVFIPNQQFSLQPYLFGKVYIDINKAFVWQVKYMNYTIDQTAYQFNAYGKAFESAYEEQYSDIFCSVGLTVSFNVNDEN